MIETFSPPTTLSCAWIGSPAAGRLGLPITAFDDSDDFLLAVQPYDFDFYLVRLTQRGVRGLDLIRLIRRRSDAGIVALTDRLPEEFVAGLAAGADMVLAHDANAEHLLAAMQAIQRRSRAAAQPRPAAGVTWSLLVDRSILRAPDGTEIALSDSDLAVMQCFVDSEDGRVQRRQLVERLWGAHAGTMDNALHATVYRLRKRIEQSGQQTVPLRALAKVGYEFRASLRSG